MKNISYYLLLAALLAASCQREPSVGGNGEINGSSIPADFTWETTQDVSMTVGMPSVSGLHVDYAVVRVYSSPKLIESNLVAQGVVSASNPSFRTAFTLPLTKDTLFVQTTLPNGTIAVQSASVASQVKVAGAVISSSPARKNYGLAAPAPKSTMTYPILEPKGAGDFPQGAIISQTPSQQFDLGAEWAYAAPAYYIPVGAVINGNINLSGGFGPYSNPILYVAGTLNLTLPNIGMATLAVLPGGVVAVACEISAQNKGRADQPAIYVFEGGKLTAASANLSAKSVVNCGRVNVLGRLDINNQLAWYNTDGAVLHADGIMLTNSTEIHNDGEITADAVASSSSAQMVNYEKGVLTVDDYTVDSGTKIYQNGNFVVEELTLRGSLYVGCYTYADRINADQAKVFIATGACLDVKEAVYNNTDTDLSAGALFIADNYSVTKKNGGKFVSKIDNDATMPVVKFGKALCSKDYTTRFHGAMEVVYDDSEYSGDYVFDDKNLQGEAVLHPTQKVNIPATECNKGKGEIESEPEPKPDYNDVPGADISYCFEDNWPWTGDYDMNDAVVRIQVDRRENKQGLVESIKICWELLASGAVSNLSLGVQFDNILTSQVASVETTNTNFGAGAFAGAGLEQGSDFAVIALFNSVKEVFSENTAYINTYKGSTLVETTKHVTTVTFTQPVVAENFWVSKINPFIVVNPSKATTFSREVEVHLPGFTPSVYADVENKDSVLPTNPYRYYKKTEQVNNGMVWGLSIPGVFYYPSEKSDIREAYTYFNAWATSGGGTVHGDWYLDEVDESLIY